MTAGGSPSTAAHGATVFKTSEFLGIVLFITATILQRTFPLDAFSLSPSSLLNVTGVVLILTGVVILRLTHRELGRFEQPHAPGIPTTRLIQSGPFRWSRNPTYAAILLVMVPGIGLLLRNPWAVLLMPATGVAFHFVLIREEELYLRQIFRGEWEDYCMRTPRWI